MKNTKLALSDRKLIHTALEIEKQEAQEAGKLGYMARVLTQATIPHSDPSSVQFIRKNGNFKITITDVGS